MNKEKSSLKVDKEKVGRDKSRTKNANKYSQRNGIIVALVLVVLVVIGINFASSYALRQNVEVVTLKSSVPQDGMITMENMVKGTMTKADYEKQGLTTLSDGSKKRSIILWEDRDKVKNTFASYFIRKDSPLHWDALSSETPKKYSYLYQMDGELLKLDIDANTFGEMLVPGDHVNIRVSYTEQQYTLPSEQEFMMQQQTGIQAQTSVKTQEKLFNDVPVLDILNSAGESIFDIYYEILALPKNKQYEIVNSEDFSERVAPVKILLNVTPEEADHYMNVMGKGPTYMMTLLPRTGSNLITEALNELQTGFARTNK